MIYKQNLADCIKNIDIIRITGSAELEITDIEYDSRKITGGNTAFFALPGIHADGKTFIDSAITKGAVCIFYEGSLESFKQGVCYIEVKNARKAMSAVSARFYQNPSADLGVIGVTGTEGKSSTVSFIFQLMNLCGKRTGFFSTVEYSADGTVIPNPEHQTTPETNAVQKHLAAMRDSGCLYAVAEASSHGLSPKTARLLNVIFDAGIFMNVTQEHLEFHGTLEQYRYDKANLFRALDVKRNAKKAGRIPVFGVVNYEDPNAEYFIKATAQRVYPFSTDIAHLTAIKKADGLFAKDLAENSRGITFTLCSFQDGTETEYPAHLNLAGLFNVKNILAAVITVHRIAKIPIKEIIEKLPLIKPVKGRMMKINEGQNFEVIIDYAHTPSSFMTILPPIYRRAQKNGNKVLCVFGSGGERDLQKRPEQGRIAALYSDIIILADEDPRGEDPTELLEMIAEGCPGKKRGEELYIIPNRYEAIRKAFSIAKKDDIVLLLGKGHENSIIYKDKTIPYDEETAARTILKESVSA